ncbi:hypothetical protein [Sphingomonas alba]|uniref:DUF2306 domain-containing protein n=1 Tax=Sphingomonas alba TaxID=2908208 RepID=A0ABT0RP89_9SPHN|nr:hypothetical protein [Sphingomonas alba]MCL6684292.1 hypothetical protein [Sphingomonas alba]
MATLADTQAIQKARRDALSGTPRAHAVDRWIFVGMAVWFIAIVLAGFIPDSIMKVGLVQSGQRAPFPIVLHMHAVLMGSFLLLMLAQSWLMATGRKAQHMRLGLAGMVLAPALVVVGFILAPTMYHMLWDAAQAAPAGKQAELQGALGIWEDILLLQIRIGVTFAIFMAIALAARIRDSGMHKRMIFLAVAMALPAGFDRIPWLWSTMPVSPLSADVWVLVAVAPMFLWDVIRNRWVHPAYVIWLALNIPLSVAVFGLWDTPWWHHAARQIMGVG